MKHLSTFLPPSVALVSFVMCGAAWAQTLWPLDGAVTDSVFWEPTNGPTGPAIESLSRGMSGTIIAATYSGTYRMTSSQNVWEGGGPFASSSAAGPGGVFFVGSNGQWLYRSTDDGLHWTQLIGLGRNVRTIVGTPGESAFAGTAVNEPGVANKGAVFYSSNLGTSWVQVFPREGGTMSFAVQCIAIDSNGHLLFSNERGALYHSPDTGKTYTLPSDVEATTGLLVGPDGTLFAASRRGVFRSTTHGTTWSQSNEGLADTLVSAIALHMGGEIIAATPSGLFRSTTMGSTWVGYSSGLKNASGVLWRSDQELVAGSGSGAWRSTDAGQSWHCINTGMSDDYVTAFGIAPGERIYAGVRGGAYWTEDRGRTWVPSLADLGPEFPAWFCFKQQMCFAACSDSGVYRSTDGGGTWFQANVGLPKYPTRTVGVANSGALVLGTWGAGVYRSTDDGLAWSHIPTGTDTIVTAFARTGAGVLLLGSEGAVLRSTNEGLSWVSLRSGLPTGRVRGISVGGTEYLFAGLDDGGIFRSTDDGASWAPCNVGLPITGTHVFSLVSNRAGHLLVGTNEGVYRSTNSGDSWEDLNAGPPIRLTTAVVVDSEGYAYAGTGGAGVWRSVAPTVVTVRDEQPSILAAELYRNYPNPFNATTMVRYQLQVASNVMLVVFDMLGRSVTALVNERKEAGVYEVSFDASDLSSGVYFYRLTAGNVVQTRKLLLLR